MRKSENSEDTKFTSDQIIKDTIYYIDRMFLGKYTTEELVKKVVKSHSSRNKDIRNYLNKEEYQSLNGEQLINDVTNSSFITQDTTKSSHTTSSPFTTMQHIT